MAWRIVWDHLGYRLAVAATSEAVGFEARNLEDGSRRTFWKATGTGDQTLTYDAGVGKTETADTVVMTRADLLVNVTAHVAVQYSTDMSAWTDAFTKTPLAAGDLKKPTDQDFYNEFTTQTKRGWRIRIYGTPSAAASFSGLWLGSRLDVEKAPIYGNTYGMARADRGAELTLSFQRLTEAGMGNLLTALHAVTPGFPAEAPVEAAAGGVYGGRPHFLYDTLGEGFRLGLSAVPALLNVLLITPEALVPLQEWHRRWTLGPLRWRTMV